LRGLPGIEVFELARLMGTSVTVIDKTYGQLAKGHVDRVRQRMNVRPSIAGKTPQLRGHTR
jgi:hypothetical protein